MEIIKPGRIIGQTKEFECKECGCVFKAESTEYSKYFDAKNDIYCVAICPWCGESVYVDSD